MGNRCHGNELKCWEEGTKYWVVEVIKNVTGQVIELYKLQRIRIPRFCAHCFSFGKYYHLFPFEKQWNVQKKALMFILKRKGD